MTLSIDINCFVGFWPFRRISYRSVNDIRNLMDRTNTHGVLLTPLASLFYKDTLSAVSELLEELNVSGYEYMWPIAVINPSIRFEQHLNNCITGMAGPEPRGCGATARLANAPGPH
jgi:hypothetical protein